MGATQVRVTPETIRNLYHRMVVSQVTSKKESQLETASVLSEPSELVERPMSEEVKKFYRKIDKTEKKLPVSNFVACLKCVG